MMTLVLYMYSVICTVSQSLSLFRLYHTSNDIPQTRYLSSIGFLYNTVDGRGPEALVFGGDGGLLHNSYTDSYGFVSNTFFDDVWLLSPREVFVSSTMMKRNREEYCDWRWSRPDSTSMQTWNKTCMHMNDTSLPGECSLKDIMIAAWCRGQFQSLTMS